MLWDAIYEFYVSKIFGGFFNRVRYDTFFSGGTGGSTYLNGVQIELFGQQLSLGNYLSFVATLITLIIILVLCCLFIKKIISLMGKLFSGGTL